VTCIVLHLDYSVVLLLSEVSSTLYRLCEGSWSALYERRFGRYTRDPKNSYRQMVRTTGTVMYYDYDMDEIRGTAINDVKKYAENSHYRYVINAHDECWYYSNSEHVLVETGVVDILVDGHLYVLTSSSYDIYHIHGKPILTVSHPIQARRILEPGYVEMEDGRVMSRRAEWFDVTAQWMRTFDLLFNDGSSVRSRFKNSNVEIWWDRCRTYLCCGCAVCSVCHVLPECVLRACSYNESVAMVTKSGKLLHWNGNAEDEVEQLDENVLPWLFREQHRMYYIRRN
jgi:hypothetical protein